jgi:hypothetical protein
MKIQELLAQNLSAAVREALNAELVAKEAGAKLFPDQVFWTIHQARQLLEDAQTLLTKAAAEKGALSWKDIEGKIESL